MIKHTLPTISHLLIHRTEISPDAPAFRELNNVGVWDKVISWKDFHDQVLQTAARLYARGVRPSDKVAVFLPNCLAWEVLHHAILRLGAVMVAMERYDPVERQRAIFDSALPVAIFAQRVESVAFLEGNRAAALTFAVIFQGTGDQSWETWEQFNAMEADIASLPPMPEPDAPCTLIYTSGTTGEVKGILYTHGQMMLACQSIARNYGVLEENRKYICFLPLSALFQRMANAYAMIAGVETYLLEDPRRIMEVIAGVSPDFFIGVPRFYEKLWAGIEERIRLLAWPLRYITRFAIGIAGVRARRIREGKSVAVTHEMLFRVLDALILVKIRSVMGKNLRIMVSGSAPMPVYLLEYFHALGFLILEAYGLSENIIPMAMNKPSAFKFGTVGLPLVENEIRFDVDSVIHVKGPGLFSGYYEQSDAPLSADGFYNTGDFGKLVQGYLTLSGRQAELIKTSTGRRISPVTIENVLKQCPCIDQAVVFGSGHKRLIALITLNEDVLRTCKIPAFVNESPSPQLAEALKEGLNIAVKQLPAAEQPGGYIVLQNKLSIDQGEITTNQKLRRRNIQERYQQGINQMFQKVDLSQKGEVEFLFYSQAQALQARFADVPVQQDIVSSRLKRVYLLTRMVWWVSQIKFWDSLPHLELGEASREERRTRNLKKIGAVITQELSYLKGPAAKLGQMASYLADTVPAPIQQSLASLQSGVVPLATERIIKIIEQSLGRPINAIFAHFETVPLAAASVSQVHLARLLTGETVVVKVLYPQSRTMISADIENLKVIFPLLGQAMGITNGDELMAEMLQMLKQECDLLREATNQEIFYRIFKDEPSIIIPKVYRAYSSKEVLTMEYVNGVSFEQFNETATQAQKNRAAEIIGIFSTKAITQYGILNADPHPGNYLFVGDQVCFLDFGFVKRWPKSFIDLWKQQSLAGSRNDMDAFTKSTIELGFKGVKDFAGLRAQFDQISYTPWKEDKVFRFTKSFLNQNVNKVFCYGGRIGSIRIPPDYVAISRLFSGHYAINVAFEAESNWHRSLVSLLEAPTLSLEEIERKLGSDEDHSLSLGIAEIQTIVGEQYVITDPQKVSAMSEDIMPYTQKAAAFVYPKSVEEIQAILRVASNFKISVWTCSRGKNWGYGGASPSQGGEVVLVLERMNKILEVNEDLAYAVIEPGVSFRQLHEYIKSRGIALWLDCTDGPADGSVVGNSLERGVGETNYGDHFGNVCGLEVILATGELVRTGGGPMKNYASWNTYKWGVGPYLEGIFTQSNYGIVTKMGVWLMPKPECCETVFFEAKDEASFPAVIDALRRLQLNGALASKVHMINDTVQKAILGPDRVNLSKRFKISPWVFAAGIYGTAHQVRAHKELVQKELSPLGKLLFINQTQVRLLEQLFQWGGLGDSKQKPKRWLRQALEFAAGKPIQLIEMIPHISSIERGEPSDYFVKHAYYKAPVAPPKGNDIDPVRDRCGMVWLGPMVPLVGDQLKDLLDSCRVLYAQHNTEFYVALMLASPRTMIALFAIFFDKSNPQETENAHRLYMALGEHTQRLGYQQYRTSTAYMDKILDPAAEFQDLARRIKKALDPDGILAPGKYGI